MGAYFLEVNQGELIIEGFYGAFFSERWSLDFGDSRLVIADFLDEGRHLMSKVR
jgi:hypothetical protein